MDDVEVTIKPEYPVLASIRLRDVAASNSLNGTVNLRLRVEREIRMGPANPAEDGLIHEALAHVKFVAVFMKEDGVTLLEGIVANAFYEGVLTLPKPLPFDEMANRLKDEYSYQFSIVAQVQPVVFQHFKGILEILGVDAKTIALGVS